MPSWIINGNIEEVEREGAAARLSDCREFMPARSALQLPNSKVPPSAAGQARAYFFKRQKERLQDEDTHKSSDPHK